MSVEKNMPQIRFKGFSGEWDGIQLSDEVTIINGRAYSQDELQDKGKYPVLRVGNFYTNTSWYYSDMELGEKYYANYGDLLYTWSASFGPHIWNGEKVIYHYHIWKLELSENMDKLFLLQLLDYDREKILSGSSGSTMIHITKSGMESKIAFIPKKQEQIQIGTYFQKLDSLINQHQKKHDQLSNIKKAMLEKMFPKPGETIPEIRFKGFSGEWEELCVGEIAKTSIGEFVKQTKQNPDSPYPVFNGGKSFTGHYDDYNNEGDKILVSARGANAGFVNYQKTRFWAGNSCYSIDVSSKEEHHTIFVYFSIKRTQHLFTDFQQAANIPSVSKADVEKFKFMSPKFAEQEAIGNYFQKLDALIKQHQQQIIKLNNIKQACLSKMFV